MGKKFVEINKNNFKEIVSDPGKLVIIDLWAEWCAPCRAMEPVLEEVAASNGGKIKVTKINVDENPEMATELSVMSIPTFLFYKGGAEVLRVSGYNSADYIQKKINELL